MSSAETKAFDPYYRWLGIRDGARPPHHYRLLGLELWETDEEVIRDAAARQINHLRTFRHGRHHESYEQLLNELIAARNTLLDAAARMEYEAELKLRLATDEPEDPRPVRLAPDSSPEPVDIALRCNQCTTQNPSASQYCTGCGDPLWEPCIACGSTCRRGALHCGSCGVNLRRAIDERNRALQEIVTQAKSLRAARRFAEALALLEPHRNGATEASTGGDRISCLIAEIQTEVEAEKRRTDETVDDAKKRLIEGDFATALNLLTQISPSHIDPVIQNLIDKARSKLTTTELLTREIRQALSEERWQGLLAKVEELLHLQPHSNEMQTLRGKLQDFDAEQKRRQREQLQKTAEAAIRNYRYDQAVRLLEQIDESQRDAAIEKLLGEAKRRADEVAWLRADLREAVTYDEHLLPICQRLLKLCPNDAAASKLAQHLSQRSTNSANASSVPLTSWPRPPAKNSFGLPIESMAMFRNIDVDQLKSPQLLADPGDFSVAAGLALQGLQKSLFTLNLAPPEKAGVLRLLKGRKSSPTAAWGIDLGRSALKAIKLTCEVGSGRFVVTECDRMAHDLDAHRPASELHASIERSLQAFLDRHDLKDAAIALGLPAQRAVTRFFTLPMVDKKKIGDVMQYEVKQQIPLPFESIGWDYQILKTWTGEKTADSACVPDTRVALFAMKQGEVEHRLSALAARDIKVDVLQSDAAALLNFLMHERQGCTETDSKQDEPPAWAVLDIGTDSSNFAITNGCSVFVRSIPLGGNDLTRALAKRYQLNPAHAEKLKRNPTKAPLLHQMYEALEPSFRNLAIEVQRSIDQYRSTEINPAIQQLYVRGGGLKLHGLLRAILYARANQEIA